MRRSVCGSWAAVRARWGVSGRWVVSILAGVVVVVGCSWPLARSHPVAGVWAIGITAGYACAAYPCAAVNRRVARWLLVCALLWAGSMTDAALWAAVLATACWVALWVTLAVGAVMMGGDNCKGLSPRAWPGSNDIVRGVPGARRGPNWIKLAAGLSAGAVAATSLVVAVVSWLGAGGVWATLWWPGPVRSPWTVVVQGACAAAAPLGVGVGAWRRRSARAGVSALLTQLATPLTVEGVQAVLRTALGDPTAAVFYRLPGVPDFVSAADEQVELPGAEPGRLVPAVGSDGKIAALLTVDESLNMDARRVHITVAVSR